MSTHLDFGYFYCRQFRTENGPEPEDALSHFDLVLAAGDGVCIEQHMNDLLSVPNRFAYTYTGCPQYPMMRDKIMNAFPANPADLPKSFVKHLLTQLSTLFHGLPPNALVEDRLRLVGQYKRYVTDVWPALSVLLDTDFAAIGASRAKRSKFVPKVNEVPLNNLGVAIPSNADEAKMLMDEILCTLKSILHFYLDLLSEPDLADFVWDAYFSGNDPLRPELQGQSKVHADVDPVPAIHPQLQSFKAALQVDNVEGFGRWEIIMSSGATKDLKEIKRSNKERAEFVVNKIFQLSKGRFSGNNQRRLNGPSHGIPIYQAEVLSNLRIVYQIDCVPDDDGVTEHQAVKIYRILTYKKLDHIWERLSNHLSKCKEYRERCIFRQCISGTSTYIPASFPRRQMDPADEETHVVFGDDDLSQEYSSFLLDKYVKFSKAYLNGLIADEEVQLPFQLTPNEWEIVQSTTSCFVIGRSGTGKTTVMLYKMLGIHRAWQKTSSCPKPRQVFVTRSRVLRAKVEESFDNWLDFFSLEGRTREELKWRRDQGIGRPGIAKIDPMNASDCRIGTPRKFSELTDHDFPLFITFDHLARLVAADLQHDHNPYAKLLTCLDENYSLIKYDDFENHYWTRLPQHATRGLEPWLVFSEFMGVIKGSEAALHQPGGSLNKETYVEMPARTHQSFAHQREALYKLFEAYCFLKQQKWSYDMADRTYSVLKPLLFGVPLEGQRVHYMYVDEVQDLLPIDALLLRILCRNPDGLIWAGDTAQTISAGSSFRFEDLTAFMYRAERDSTMGLAMCRIKPIVFQLTTNYRSHSGIINCAQSVIELIGRFWPNTIDILRPEHGIIFGREPVFFSDWEEGMFSPEKFFSGMKEKQVELGAKQCILVRNNNARERLKKKIGDRASILTLQDSKGLEFDDVFLYNFFEDSAVGYAQWSLVLAGCGDDRMSLAFERDESKFAVLCTELKALYVGITRSRNKLYLLDKSNKSKPMRTFWSSRDLIRRAPAETNIFQYVVRSTADEWAAAGRNFFAAEKFKEAIRCFQRAGDSYQCELRIAQAFQYREDAKHASPVSEARSAFLVAGDAFTDCAKEALNFERRMAWYNNAGDCYSNGHDVNRAGISYMMAENFMAATRVYYDAKNFDEIIQMFECHHTKIMPDYSSTLFTVCRQHYGSKNIRPPKPLFPSIEEELDYLKMKGFDNTLIDVSECHGKNMRAAEVYLGRGQPVKAIQSCLKHQQDDATLECAVNIALVNLWSWYSFAAAPAKKFLRKGTVSDILKIVLTLPSERLNASDRYQIQLFEALHQALDDKICHLGYDFLHHGENLLALAAFDRVFSQLPPLTSASLDEMDQFLKKFNTYVRALISVISDRDPLSDQKARRMFGVIELPNRYYEVQEDTFLYDKSTLNRFLRVDLDRELKSRLRVHLCRKVTEEIQLCCRNPRFSATPCLSYLVDRICHVKRCQRGHVSRDSEGPERYNVRVSIHLRQICILQLMHDNCPQEGWNSSTRDWLLRLYDAIYPPLYFQGSVANLDLSTIEDIGSCMVVLQKWIEDTLQYLLSDDDFWKYLMEVTRLARLALTFGGRLIVFDSIRIAKCSPFYWVPSLRPINLDDRFVIESVLKGLDDAEDDCISHGVSALQYMLHKGVRLDLSTIYDYLEEMCSTLIISSHLRPGGCSSTHDLVVPRKWLASPNKLSCNKDTSSAPAFFAVVQELLDRLRSGKAQKWFALPRNSESFIDITVAKLCRLLCIVGYNSCDAVTSEKIANILLFSLRAEIVESNPQGTVNVIRRSEYLSAIRSFDQNTGSEDLVQLIHLENSHTTSPVCLHIAFIVYDDVADIPRIVCHSPDVFALLAVQGPYIELTGAEFTEDSDDCKWSYPTEEVTAACQIQMAYRLHRVRCASPIPPLSWVAAADKFFMLCLEEVISLGWKPDPYRRVYLNKLPILLACLEQGLKITYAVRKEASEHLSIESGKKWENTVACISQSTILIEEGKLLRKTLDPQAPLHDRSNMHVFRTTATKVSKFIRRIPIDGEGWDASLQDAVDSVIADLWNAVEEYDEDTGKCTFE